MRVAGTVEQKVSPCVRDPLGYILFPQKWPNLLISLSCVLVLGSLPLVAANFFGLFKNSALRMDAMHDIGYWCVILLACGLILAVSLWQQRLASVFNELRLLGVSTHSDHEFNMFVESTKKTYGKLWIRITPYIVAFFLTLAGAFAFHLDQSFWQSFTCDWHKQICGYLQIAPCFIAWYVSSYTMTRLLATYLVFRDFFKSNIRVDPLHPDGCGGLYPLGSLSMRLNILVIVLGLLAAVTFYFNMHTYRLDVFHPINLILVTSYAMTSAVIFFLPLYAARKTMYEAKMNALHDCELRRKTLSDGILRIIKLKGSPTAEQITELHRFDELFTKISQMPIYPFNTKIVVSFILSWVIPIIAPFLSALVQIFM